MFIIADLLFKFLDKIKPKRNAIGVAKKITTVTDIIVFIALILVVINVENEIVSLMNKVFLDIIKLYILSVILGASTSGRLFREKSSFERESNLIGIKLLLYLVPLILVIIPMSIELGSPKFALILYYIVFVLLTKTVFYLIEGAYAENSNDENGVQLK